MFLTELNNRPGEHIDFRRSFCHGILPHRRIPIRLQSLLQLNTPVQVFLCQVNPFCFRNSDNLCHRTDHLIQDRTGAVACA